jgi:SAM-dependent methyltransferase
MSQEELPSPSLDIADEVRRFYDRYPYPRPVDSLEQYRRLWEDSRRRRADHHLFWPDRPYREDHSILVAGCGTSQAAKHALRWPNAQVIGIDVSATSVQYTEGLKRKYNLKNLLVHQLAIEQVNQLGMSFDQIVSTGVLHHLRDPDAGLAALHDVLKPDGGMHLMVYAPYGRTGIYMLQEFCRRIGVSATDDGIRDLITALKALPPGHPLGHILREAPDFQQNAELADALLHPQDRAYSVPQLFDFIERGQFIFGRWIKQAPYVPQCGALAQIPQASQMAELSLEEQYAAAELFRGTMVRHSVIVYPKDRLGGTNPISFTGHEWLRYVPIRMPDTVCVQTRLSTGPATVLINRNHSYTDIFMVVNFIEKSLFDAMDGYSSIGEILSRTIFPQGQSPHDVARSLFERLWWHDQVVFDSTQVPPRGPDSSNSMDSEYLFGSSTSTA